MNQLRATRMVTHAACWLIFFSLPILFMTNQNHGGGVMHILLLPSYWVFCITFLALFYLSGYFLVPKLYLKRKYLSFFTILALLLAAVYLLRPFDRLMSSNRQEGPPLSTNDARPDFRNQPPPDASFRNQPPPELDRPPGPPERRELRYFDIVSVFLFIMVIALTMAIQINRELYLTEKKAIKAEADKAEAELSFLKAQVNPHFLFNTLNNIYTLAVSSHPNTAESIMKLSNIMRYVTDDAGAEMVSLQDELDCISDFIGLQELRLGDRTPISYSVSGTVINQKIAPLILMSFVENLFKYGISKQESSPLVITIEIDNNSIYFHSRNKIFDKGSKLNRTGIGINNTRQRLNHMYPLKHELEINRDNGFFTVDLKLHS